MCGIIASFSSIKFNQAEKIQNLKMLGSLEKRGPDASNFISQNHVFLGHTRLSIIDTRSIANQPFSNVDDKYTILFNGEIYNYKNLKEKLIIKGYVFKTNSDTEVILNLFIEYGVKSFGLLRGMFAILVYDKIKEEIILARDSVGIKPLYYYSDKKKLIISSQVKTITHSSVNKEIDFESKIDFYLMGFVIEPKTIFKNIKSVKSGNYIKFKLDKNKSISLIEENKYQINFDKKDKDLSFFFEDTIKSHLVSDVDIGLFLSSGIDSSAIASELLKYKKKFLALNLAFKEYRGKNEDESILAKKISLKTKMNYKQLNSDETELLKFKKIFFEDMDQPTIDGLNTWILSNHAKKTKIKVFLSGLGLDELLFGYKTREYIQILNILKYFKRIIKIISFFLKFNFFKLPRKIKYFHKYLDSFADLYVLKRSNLLFEEIYFLTKEEINFYKKNSDLYKILNQIDIFSNNLNEKIYYAESQLYMKNMLLRDSDWAGMANSIEIRVPFADCIFRDQISNKYHQNKKINKKIVFSILNQEIKKIIKNRKKTGFNIPKNIFINEKILNNSKYTQHVYEQYFRSINTQ